MPSIKKAATLTKEIIAINLISNAEGLNVVPMMVGAHGIGKSQIVKQVARDMNGYCYTVEGGSLKEGEITGLPFAQQNTDGSSEVRFIKYYAINKIWQLEKYYYEIAKTTGFLNGSVKLIIDEEGNETLVENGKSQLVKTKVDKVEAGEDNRYKFGDELSAETKLKLIESGEIKPVVLFIDELNRTEQQTMKELMNIILNKTINGYDLPWFVQIVSAINPCSQNSTYATNELDDAQLDRFLKLKVEANIEDWIDYSLEKKVNNDIIEALAVAEGIFIHREKGQEDTSEMTPSPRSWEMVSNIYNFIHEAVKTKFFSDEERKGVNDDLRVLIRGKVGETAARTLLETINRKENNIKPAEIFTMAADKIEPKIVEKFKAQKRLTQKIISDNCANFILNNVTDILKLQTSKKAEDVKKYKNFEAQLKEFVLLLDNSTQILFVKKFIKPGDQKGFLLVARVCSKDVLATIYDSSDAIKKLREE